MTDAPSSVPRVTVSRCMEVVSKAFGVSTRELAGQSRAQPLARQRQIAMWLARRATRLSYARIGKEMGQRDHSTIHHGCAVVSQLRREQETVRAFTDETLGVLLNGKEHTQPNPRSCG